MRSSRSYIRKIKVGINAPTGLCLDIILYAVGDMVNNCFNLSSLIFITSLFVSANHKVYGFVHFSEVVGLKVRQVLLISSIYSLTLLLPVRA